MQALDEHNLSLAEAASSQFDADLWRLSNRLKDEADAKSKEKSKENNKDEKTSDSAPPKLQLMPDAMPKPLLSNLSIMSLELRAGLLMAKKQNEEAKKLYVRAAREEKALGYHEPPPTSGPLAKRKPPRT